MKSISLVLLSFLSLSLRAQEKKQEKMSMPIMIRAIGVSFQGFDGLNSRVKGLPQYETLKDHMFTISLGSMQVRKNFISQLSLTGGSSLSGDRDKKSSALRSYGGSFALGYDVIPSDRIMLYPLAGIGAEAYHAIFYKDNSAVNFNDVLLSSTVQNDIRSVKFTNSFFTYNVGLGFALKSPKGPGIIGLQAGYSGSFKDKTWKSSENQVLNNAPSDDLGRFNISLVFGGAGRMTR